MARIGVYGGTFDPPHNGHVALARAALEALPIDRLVVLVAADPGHRDVFANAEERLQLHPILVDQEVRVGADARDLLDGVTESRWRLRVGVALLHRLGELKLALGGLPMLVGTSRKRFIGELLGGAPTDQRL